MVRISDVRARQVWDSRGHPTIEVELRSDGGNTGRGIAPAGASTGRREAVALLDGGQRFGGRGVAKAIEQVTKVLRPLILGTVVESLEHFDESLINQGIEGFSSALGANTTTAASLAMLRLLAAERGVPAWQMLTEVPKTLPRPQVQVIGGGAHAAHRVAVQDFMIYPTSSSRLSDALEQIAEVYRLVGELLSKTARKSGVADEGGHWPQVADTEEAIRLIVEGIQAAGLVPGAEMSISLDVAASQFFKRGHYIVGEKHFSSEEWVAELARLSRSFPITSIEDPVHEDDDIGMISAVSQCSSVIVGDDYLVTDAARIEAVPRGSVEAVLVKVNQIGTVTGARKAVEAARNRGLSVIVSARSGETEDTSVSHLGMGWQADVLKVGSITRGERTAKWNELLRIDDYCGGLYLAPPLIKPKEPR